MRASTIVLLVIFLLTGCMGGETEKSRHSRDSSNQVSNLNQIQESNSTEYGKEQTVQFKFERDAAYGSTDEVIVGEIATFTVEGRGRVFIADRDRTTVHVFDSDGSYLTSLGRKGKGPGEFSSITTNTSIEIQSDRMYVTDTEFYFPHRANVYLLEDLAFSHTMKLLAENKKDYEELKGYYPKQIFPLQNGTFLAAYQRSPHDYRDSTSFIRYIVQDTSGVIHAGPVLEQANRTNLVHRVKNTRMPYWAIHAFPFFAKALLDVSSEGLLYAANNTDEFKINVHTSQGEHLRTIRHPFDNVSLDRNRLLESYQRTGYMSELGKGVALEMIRQADNLPGHWPALETMFFDDQDRLWVATIVEDFGVYEWWVLKSSGEVITRFEWPRERDLRVVRNGYAYTLEAEEETGLQRVVRYRIDME